MNKNFILVFLLVFLLQSLQAQNKDSLSLKLAGGQEQVKTKGKFHKSREATIIKEYPVPEKEKKELLKEFALKLNGYWLAAPDSVVTKFTVSAKNFNGQSIIIQKIQQVGPILISLYMTEWREMKVIRSSPKKIPIDTLDIDIVGDKLNIGQQIYFKQKK